MDIRDVLFNKKIVMSQKENYKPCKYDNQKLIGFIYIPSTEQFMCKSISQYYARVQLLEQGYTKEKAEEITKTMIL